MEGSPDASGFLGLLFLLIFPNRFDMHDVVWISALLDFLEFAIVLVHVILLIFLIALVFLILTARRGGMSSPWSAAQREINEHKNAES